MPSTLRVEVEATRDGAPLRVRDPATGRYVSTGGPGSQGGLLDRNRVLAFEAQKAIARNLQENILRPNVSTGRLLQVTKDPKNVSWSRTGFAIGDPKFLDSSQAKYWRTIDQGTDHWKHPFVGSTFWASKRRAYGATIALNEYGWVAGPEWSAAGASTGGKANFISRRAVATMFAKYQAGDPAPSGGRRKDPRVYLTQIKIQNDIKPKHYYLIGFRESGVIDKGVRSYFYEFSQHLPGGPGRGI